MVTMIDPLRRAVQVGRNRVAVTCGDVTLTYALPGHFLGARAASVYVTGTDLFLITNYTGLDPIVNGNSAAVGGSGAVGIDFGNFPMPRGVNFGLRVGF